VIEAAVPAVSTSSDAVPSVLPPELSSPFVYTSGVRQQTARRLLAWLLYVVGGMMIVAFLAVVMPTSAMATIAGWLGVGPLPRSPLIEYLTRSLSAMYGVLGVLHLYLARDVIRYLDLIIVIGWLTVVAGAIVTVVDFTAGMPPLWSWNEGPPTVLAGLPYVWLARRARPTLTSG
jgi:hypothetical protein